MRGDAVTTGSLSELEAFASGDWRQRVADALAFANPSWVRTTELRRAQAELGEARAAAARGPVEAPPRSGGRVAGGLRRVGGRLRRAVRL